MREHNKKLQAFKTAVPLVLTLSLLAVVYILVLVPDSPGVVLTKALYNSFDTSKQKSWRYDGSFGDKDNDFAAEYNGQKASSGDSEFYIKFTSKERTATYHEIKKGNYAYYLVSGTDSIPTIISAIPGAMNPDLATTGILTSANSSWIKATSAQAKGINKLIPCSDKSLSVPTVEQLKLLTGSSMPVEITGGPYSANDGSQSRVFEVGLKKSRIPTDYEGGVVGFINCIDSLRGEDFKLRKANSQDIDILKLNITVDPLSNTITHAVYGQFSQYFQFSLRDYNKDITITAPDSPVSVGDYMANLDEQTRAEFVEKTGL